MDPVLRRPRNARLSAYYGLQGAADNSRTLSSPGTPNIHAAEDGSWAPADLIKRLPLAQLVRTSTKIRNDAEQIERSLHGSVRDCYAQLDEAAAECSKITKITSQLGNDTSGTLQAIASACQKCNDISAKMQPVREKIENLEESRRVMLLFRAAGLLAKQLPNQFAELTELCTDPQSARDRLFLTAHRCSIIAPQLERMSTDSESFADAHAQLSTAMSDVVSELHSQLEEDNGSLEGLSLADVMHIRIYLLISDDGLRAFFLNTAEAILQSKKPTSETIRIAARSKLSLAAFYLRHAAKVVLEDIRCVCAAYDDVFRGDDCFMAQSKKRAGEDYREDSVLSSDAFTVWISSTVDELVGTAIRRALAGNPSESAKGENSSGRGNVIESDMFSVEDIVDFKESLLIVRETAKIGAGASGTSLGQVPVIIGTLCDSICKQVQQAITSNVTVQIKSMFDRALFSDFDSVKDEVVARGNREVLPSVLQLRKVVSAVQELAEKSNCLLEELLSEEVEQTAVEAEGVGGDALQSLRKESLFRNSIEVDIAHLLVQMGSDFSHSKADRDMRCRALLRASFLCSELGDVLRNMSLSRALSEVVETLNEEFTTKIVDDASEIFRRFVFPRDSENHLDRFVDGSSVAQQVIDLMERARMEVDNFPAQNSSLHEIWKHVLGAPGKANGIGLHSSEGLDSGGVVHRIAENWVQCVRGSSISREKKTGIERLVGEVGRRLEAVDIFEAVSRTAAERCRTI